jgi:hypothetical protein
MNRPMLDVQVGQAGAPYAWAMRRRAGAAGTAPVASRMRLEGSGVEVGSCWTSTAKVRFESPLPLKTVSEPRKVPV